MLCKNNVGADRGRASDLAALASETHAQRGTGYFSKLRGADAARTDMLPLARHMRTVQDQKLEEGVSGAGSCQV